MVRFCASRISVSVVYARQSICRLRFISVSSRYSAGDEELDTLIKATIAGGGVIPHIHRSLMTKGPTTQPLKKPKKPELE